MRLDRFLPYVLAASLSAAPVQAIPSHGPPQPPSRPPVSEPAQVNEENNDDVLEDLITMYAQGGFIEHVPGEKFELEGNCDVPVYLNKGDMLFPVKGNLYRIDDITPKYFDDRKEFWVDEMTNILCNRMRTKVKLEARSHLKHALNRTHDVLSTYLKNMKLPQGQKAFELPYSTQVHDIGHGDYILRIPMDNNKERPVYLQIGISTK